MPDPLHVALCVIAILAAFIAGRRIAPSPKMTSPPRPIPPPVPMRLLHQPLGEALAESHRKLWGALRTFPEQVAAVPADRILMAKARKNERHAAWIKVSVPDEIVLALGKRPEGRRYEVILVTIPGPAAEISG